MDTGREICSIERAYADLLEDNELEVSATFGEVTDTLEEYLKQNNND